MTQGREHTLSGRLVFQESEQTNSLGQTLLRIFCSANFQPKCSDIVGILSAGAGWHFIIAVCNAMGRFDIR